MTWTVLQSVSNFNAGGTTVAATFTTANLSSGSKILCWLNSDSATGGVHDWTGVSDGTNALSNVKSYNDTNGTFQTDLWVEDTPSGLVGTKPTITATWNNAAAASFGLAILLQEVSGLAAGATTAILDGGVVATSSGNSNSAATGSYTSTASSEFLCAVYVDPGTGASISTPPAGYTADPHNVLGNGDANLAVYYKNSSSAAESATFGLSAAGNWGTLLTAFQLGGPPITSGPPLAPRPMGRPVTIVTGAGWRGANHSR